MSGPIDMYDVKINLCFKPHKSSALKPCSSDFLFHFPSCFICLCYLGIGLMNSGEKLIFGNEWMGKGSFLISALSYLAL